MRNQHTCQPPRSGCVFSPVHGAGPHGAAMGAMGSSPQGHSHSGPLSGKELTCSHWDPCNLSVGDGIREHLGAEGKVGVKVHVVVYLVDKSGRLAFGQSPRFAV